MRFLLGVSLIFAADSGFSWAVSGVFRPVLSAERVRRIGEESRTVGGLDGRLRFVERKIGQLVDGMVSNCSAVDSTWELNQVIFLLFYHEVLFCFSFSSAAS